MGSQRWSGLLWWKRIFMESLCTLRSTLLLEGLLFRRWSLWRIVDYPNFLWRLCRMFCVAVVLQLSISRFSKLSTAKFHKVELTVQSSKYLLRIWTVFAFVWKVSPVDVGERITTYLWLRLPTVSKSFLMSIIIGVLRIVTSSPFFQILSSSQSVLEFSDL